LALVLAIVVLTAGAATVAWALWQYEQFSDAAGGAQARLPSVAESSLAEAGATADSPQVILVRGYGGLATGSMLLFRSDPTREEIAFLTVPRRVSGAPYSTDRPDGAEIARLIELLQGSTGVSVQHVALIDFSGISGIVDDLGGITVTNPTAFDVLLGDTRNIHFPAGQLELDGAGTAAYLSIQPATESERALREANELRVLQAVVNNLIRPSNLTQLTSTAAAVARKAETDLTTSDIVGLVAVRVHVTRVVNCNLARASSFAQGDSRSAVAVFQAKTATSPFCSATSVTPIASAPILEAGAKAVSRYGVYVFVVTLVVVMFVIAAGLWFLLRGRSQSDDEPAAEAASLAARTFDRVADAWDLWRWRRRSPYSSRPPRAPVADAVLDRLDRLRFAFRRAPTRQRTTPRFPAAPTPTQIDQLRTAPRRNAPEAPANPLQTASGTLDTAPGDALPADRVDLVVQLRNEGLSYRQISERLTNDFDTPISPTTARRLWRRRVTTGSNDQL
jgi:anionic cell wall polymer biosynthesis LytR-Cps2A-Psr (LCP) family protein